MELNTQELKDYLFHVRDLELSCYKQRQFIDRLYDLANQAENPNLSQRVIYKKQEKLTDEIGMTLSFTLFSIPWCIVGSFFFGGLLAAPLLLLIVSIGTIIWRIFDRKKVKKSNLEAHKANSEIEKENQTIKSNAAVQLRMINSQIAKIRESLRSTEQTLERFYAKNVVYQKYRGLVPITMFCEYMDSGRCTGLSGHEGAYNIYENEIRLNIIIVKLDNIIRRLDEIRDNQYMLANMLQQTNRELGQLSKTAVAQLRSLEQIEANTAVANYYSGISAMNTTYLAWAKRHELLY